MAESEDFEKMKEEWDDMGPWDITWNKIGFSKNTERLLSLLLGSLKREDSVYIAFNNISSAVVYNEFDFEKRLILVYTPSKDEFSLELHTVTMAGSPKEYKHVLNTTELKAVPLRVRKSMQRVASNQEPERVSPIIFL